MLCAEITDKRQTSNIIRYVYCLCVITIVVTVYLYVQNTERELFLL